MKLSVAIITYNEEERLPACLASVSFADEVVVVDSGSSDATVPLAEKFGARVFTRPWPGFGPQKQFAIDQCQGEWILLLDADERLPLATAQEIQAILNSDNTVDGYEINRQNYFCGRWIRHMGWWPDPVLRLFRQGSGKMEDLLVHEGVLVEGRVARLAEPLVHLVNRDLEHTMAKMNQYSTAGAQQLSSAGRQAHLGLAFGRATWAFIHNYFLRLGLLDGGPGLIIAVSDASNKFFKYAKLWQYRQGPK